MKKMLRGAAALTLAGCMMSANVLAATTFSDVPSSYWGYSFITRAAGEGIVSGLPDGSYGIEKKLSAAEFTTMVCNLFYKDDVNSYVNAYAEQLKGQAWWYGYMTVAYEKGLLANTVVGDYRTTYQAWPKDLIEGELSRYDMAQILVNTASVQGWQAASALDVLAAQAKISDWSGIPKKYQSAVANAYAREFLSGMGNGNFEGASAMTRTHGAVVLCKLLDAADEEKKNTYTNTDKLVNGKEPTQSNVSAALTALQAEFPKNTAWSATGTYTSGVLGAAYGADAYAYTVNDRVFGNFKKSKADFDEMKVGDLLYLNNLKCHVVITNVDGEDFDYTYCTSAGKISWAGYGDIDDLTSKDILYTRYEEAEETLSNGDKITELNIQNRMDDFRYDEYNYGDTWDETYRSSNFGGGTASGSRAFAYYLSDYIFGDLDVYEVKDFDDICVGDVIYVDSDDEYVVVTDIVGDTIDCIGVNSNGKVYAGELDLDELDSDTDVVYTRYAYQSGTDRTDGKLSNGKNATESNVEDLIDKFLDEKYDYGDVWKKTYKSSYFYSKTVEGDRAFAYYLSDYIFDDLDVYEVDDVDDIRIGDVIYVDSDDMYVVVTDIIGNTLYCIGVDSSDDVHSYRLDATALDRKDVLYSRYPARSDNKKDNVLSNGEEASESNAEDLIDTFRKKKYTDGDTWNSTYQSPEFSTRTVSGSQAFAYYLSDYVFGELEVGEIDDFDDLRIGDVIYLDDEDRYLVVTDVSGDTVDYISVNSKNKVYSDYLDVDDLDRFDSAYTRYPTKNPTNRSDKLSDGSAVTDTNVAKLLDQFKSEKYNNNDKWNVDTSYRSPEFSKISVTGVRAFVYYLSDYVFGDLEVNVVDVDEVRVGDVLVLDEEDAYFYSVVVDVDEQYEQLTCVSINDMGKVNWDYTIDMDDLDNTKDTVYSRYIVDEERLTSGKSITAANIQKILETVSQSDSYKESAKWDMETVYSTEAAGRCKGGQAFAAAVSDHVFGKLKSRDVKSVSDIRVGDMAYLWDDDIYVIVTDIYTNTSGKSYFRYAYAEDDGTIRWDNSMRISQLADEYDEVYTRYPS